MRFLFTGGGTGGHLYPTLSLARALAQTEGDPGLCTPPSAQQMPERVKPSNTSNSRHAILFVGARGNIDQQLLARDDIAYVTLGSKPLGQSALANAGILATNTLALLRALPIVSHFRPDVIIGSGGYASAPAVLAGALLRKTAKLRNLKIVLIEANLVPGVANRRMRGVADEIWGGYPDTETSRYFKEKFRLTGIPVRPELYRPVAKPDARRSLGLHPERFTVLVFGGSQGERSINQAVSGMGARRRLPPDWQSLHVSGSRDHEWMAAERKAEPNANNYYLFPYLDDMALAYWASDLALCRAGASTLAEVATIGLPVIFVPYPHASDEHQRANADYFASRGAAAIVQDAELSPDSLYWQLVDASEPAKLDGMRRALLRLRQPDALNVMIERLQNSRIGDDKNIAA